MNGTLSPTVSRMLALGLLAVVLGSGWLAIVQPVMHAFAEQDARIERTKELLTRFENAFDDEARVRSEIERLRAAENTSEGFLDGDDAQIIAARMQNQIQKLLAGEAGSVQSIQVLPQSEEQGFEKIGLRVTLIAGIHTMQKVFYDIETAVPYLFLDNLDIRTNIRRRRRNNPETIDQVQIRFDVFGYRKSDQS